MIDGCRWKLCKKLKVEKNMIETSLAKAVELEGLIETAMEDDDFDECERLQNELDALKPVSFIALLNTYIPHLISCYIGRCVFHKRSPQRAKLHPLFQRRHLRFQHLLPNNLLQRRHLRFQHLLPNNLLQHLQRRLLQKFLRSHQILISRPLTKQPTTSGPSTSTQRNHSWQPDQTTR